MPSQGESISVSSANGLATSPVDYDPFDQGELERVVPTTEPQREVWLADRLGQDASLAYNESVSLRLQGPLNVEALRGALLELVARHETLRSSFAPDGLSLCIAKTVALEVPLVDLAELTNGQREGRLQARLRYHVDTPFDLEHGPLFRAEIVRLGRDDHVLLIGTHHIVCDGWSFWVIVKELAALYGQRIGSTTEKLAPADSFGDYALEQQQLAASSEAVTDERYWTQRFADIPPPLDLPTDRARPARRSQRAGREDYVIGADLIESARSMGTRHRASLFTTLLAVFKVVLHRLSGQPDVVVGIPAAGQAVGDHASLVGHCVNLLPLRTKVDPEAPFSALLQAVRGTMLDAYDHQQYTFGTLLKHLRVERDPARLPLVSVMFNIDQALDAESSSFPGLTLDFGTNPRTHETFELFINAAQIQGTLRLECQYNSDLFDAATIVRWMACFETVLAQISKDPEIAVARLKLLSPADRELLASFNATQSDYPREQRLHNLVEHQAARTPDAVAVWFEGREVTYAELEGRANQIARLLRSRGVGRTSVVGLCLGRSVDMVASLLGVLKAGGTYLPLDPAFPAERLAFMVEDSGLSLVISERSLAARHGCQPERTLELDAAVRALEAESPSPLPKDDASGSPDDAAYILYTSGSTGKPKGVSVPHRAAVNFLVSMQQTPGLTAADRLVAVTTLSFDISLLELLLPLTVGARVVLASRDQALEGTSLRKLLEETSATVMQATPATWRILVEAGWRGSPQFKILCGGEPLPLDLSDALLQRSGELWNMYGPTETTVWSTCWRVEQPEKGIFIGRPIANTSVWVLDDRLEPCPIGVPGELYIGGDGVALGYFQRPALTNERFVQVSVDGEPSQRLYKTGDLGRWRGDGLLECMGRTDSQVKVRGFRIELGEIDAVLAACPGVKQAIVLAREDRPGDVRLVAYLVTSGGQLDESALRLHARKTLPEYMVPQHWIALTEVPRLPNGKVDKKRLPAPAENEAPTAPVTSEPRTDLERTLAGAFAHFLNVSKVGIHDSFFERGGHSLLAAQLASKLNQELNISLPLRVVFEVPTVAQLAAWIEDERHAADAPTPSPIKQRADQSVAPLSLAQERVWFLEEMKAGQVAFNTPAAHRLKGRLNAAAFQRAFSEMVRRQPALRTAIQVRDGVPVQVVVPAVEVNLFPPEDLTGIPEGEREQRLQELIQAVMTKRFVLSEAPLFRTRLYKLAEEEHVLLFVVHHMIWDGWSFDLFYDEMAALYEAFCNGQSSPLPELPVSYGDFAVWHREWMHGEEMARQVAYWKAHLTGHDEALHLPTDRPHPPVMSGNGATEWVTVTKEQTDALRELGRQADATLFMILFAAYYVFLARTSQQYDIVVGTPVRGRNRPELGTLMGLFVNALAIRLRMQPDRRFLDLVRDVRRVVLDAFSHPDVPFEHLVRELQSESRFPMYQAFFSFQDVRQRPENWGNLTHGRVRVFQGAVTQDLGLWFVEQRHGMTGGLTYNTDIFTNETAEKFRKLYLWILGAVLADPLRPIGELVVVPDEELQELERINATTQAYPQDLCVHAWVEQQVDRTPDQVAVVADQERMTYGELETRANRIARLLRQRGVKRGARVAVCLEHSPDLVASILAILKAGGACIPLDPRLGADRVAMIAGACGPGLVLSRSSLAEVHHFDRARTLELDTSGSDLAGQSPDRLAADPDSATAEDPVCMLFTPGSALGPKGFSLRHRAMVNLLCGMREVPGFSASDRCLAHHSISLDLAWLELLLPLTVGATAILATPRQSADPAQLRQLVESEAVTFVQASPGVWRRLLDAGLRGRPGTKALSGRDHLEPELAGALLERGLELWNVYGLGESTLWSTACRVQADTRPGDVGRPLANTTVWVLDQQRQPCAVGIPGEIYVGGDGVVEDYFNRQDLSHQTFVKAPFSSGTSDRLIKTGDRGKWLPNGTLQFLGGPDSLASVRGYQFELAFVERTLASHASVRRAVVVQEQDGQQGSRLVAWLETPDGRWDEKELRRHLKQALPDYMVPAKYTAVQALPELLHGKVDRRALRHPTLVMPAPAPVPAASTGPLTPIQRQLSEIWCQLLGTTRVALDDNFFDLGGHSLIVMQAIAAMQKATGRSINPRRYVFENLEQIASAYETAPPENADRGLLKRVFSALRRG